VLIFLKSKPKPLRNSIIDTEVPFSTSFRVNIYVLRDKILIFLNMKSKFYFIKFYSDPFGSGSGSEPIFRIRLRILQKSSDPFGSSSGSGSTTLIYSAHFFVKNSRQLLCCGAILKNILLSEIRLSWFKFRTLNHLTNREVKKISF